MIASMTLFLCVFYSWLVAVPHSVPTVIKPGEEEDPVLGAGLGVRR